MVFARADEVYFRNEMSGAIKAGIGQIRNVPAREFLLL